MYGELFCFLLGTEGSPLCRILVNRFLPLLPKFSRWPLRYIVLACKIVGHIVYFPGAIRDSQLAQPIHVSWHHVCLRGSLPCLRADCPCARRRVPITFRCVDPAVVVKVEEKNTCSFFVACFQWLVLVLVELYFLVLIAFPFSITISKNILALRMCLWLMYMRLI